MPPPGRARNPRGQGDRLRTALMDAARDLLLELGDQSKLSVRAVTARAGVSPNALYIHFATKDELLDAVMNASYKEWRAVLNGGIPADAGPIDQLRAYCHGYFQFAHERSGIFRVVFMTTIREGVPVPQPLAMMRAARCIVMLRPVQRSRAMPRQSPARSVSVRGRHLAAIPVSWRDALTASV